MSDLDANRSLEALFAPDEDVSAGQHEVSREANSPSSPTLDERIDLFLRGVHGSDRSFTQAERADARGRILGVIAANLTEELDDPGLNRSPEIAANRRAQTPQAAGAHTGNGKARMQHRFGTILRNALLVRLIGPASSAAPRQLAAASLAITLLAGTVWSGTWIYASYRAQQAIAAWVDGEAYAGRTYACESYTAGGFPTQVKFSCSAPKLTIAADKSTVVVSGKALRAVASILRFGAFDIELTGPFSIAERGQPVSHVANWTLARATVHGALSNLEQASIAMEGLELKRVMRAGPEPLLTAESMKIDLTSNATSAAAKPRIDIVAHVTDGSIHPAGLVLSQPFAAELSAVLRTGERSGPAAMMTHLRDWQAAGGRIEIAAAQVQQGNSLATATGTIGLNRNGRIEGMLNLTTTGAYGQLAESLMRDGKATVAEQERIVTALILGSRGNSRAFGHEPVTPNSAVANAPPKAGSPTVPLRFSDGEVYLGSTQLVSLPPLF